MTRNNQLSEQLNYTGISRTPTHLYLHSYDSERVDVHEGENMDEISPYIRSNAINWIHVSGLQNTEAIQQVCRFFNIDFLTTQDILNAEHLTKIEVHESYNVIILKLLFAEKENGYTPQQFCIIQGENFVLTFLERDTDRLNEIVSGLKNNVLNIRNRHSDFLLSVILNSAMTSYMAIISEIEDELEDLEERLLSPDEYRDSSIKDMQPYRRSVRLIKKSILPLKEEMSTLLHDNNKLIHKANHPFFSDVNDHLLFILQTLDGCRDMLSALADLYLSNNDRRMNNIMKQLTIVSTIFIPMTFLAGIWGMNFNYMPELDWKYGYVFAWVIMILLGVSVYIYFKRKNWN